MHFSISEDLCKAVSAAHDGRCLLAFSTGKDAIGAYIQLRRHFTDIIPFYLYLVPGLEFVEESLDYYEGILGRRILRLPHPSIEGEHAAELLRRMLENSSESVRLVAAEALRKLAVGPNHGN